MKNTTQATLPPRWKRSPAQTLLWAVCWLVWTVTASARPPNILLIVSDDQGYPDLGCIGTKPVKTPHLDRLAAEGVRGTNFYVTWPACTPSRGSVLTGRYPQRNGLYDMVRNDLVNFGHHYDAEEYAVSPEMTLGLDPREITVGDVLRRAGYATGVVGKWDMGQARRFLPLQRGFDFFYGHGNNGIDYYTHERYGVPSMFRGNQRTQEDRGTYATDLFERESLAFIRAQAAKPWFLYLCFNAPHSASSFAPSEETDASPQRKAGVGVQVPEKYAVPYLAEGLPEKLARYYGAVTRMDEAIGALLDELKARGLDRDTLVVFHSDNGGSGNGGNAPLRGSKSTMWEGGLRVPFIARWPGRLPAGRVSDDFLTTLELLPTFAAAAGAPLPKAKLDGFDALPILAGEKASARAEMFWQRRGDVAARVGQWKWVKSAKGTGLFDLTTDIGEAKDLSKERPEILARVQTRFSAWRQEMDASEPRGPFRDY